MKTFKFITGLIILLTVFSCTKHEIIEREVIIVEEPTRPYRHYNRLENYDLWYVAIHETKGTAEVPFLQKAFTVSFLNGTIYANNNIVGIGEIGDGYGIKIGSYDAYKNILETSHTKGNSDFRITHINKNKLRLDDLNQNVSYFLIGYKSNDFDYDLLFFDNIEYFLQEYHAWEQIGIKGRIRNAFDSEQYLEFTPKDNNTFRSSKDQANLRIKSIIWDYTGEYEVEDYKDTNDVKRLKLYYDNDEIEIFDLHVNDDKTIVLHHLKTSNEYTYQGIGFIPHLRSTKNIEVNRTTRRSRKRIKIKRNTVVK